MEVSRAGLTIRVSRVGAALQGSPACRLGFACDCLYSVRCGYRGNHSYQQRGTCSGSQEWRQ